MRKQSITVRNPTSNKVKINRHRRHSLSKEVHHSSLPTSYSFIEDEIKAEKISDSSPTTADTVARHLIDQIITTQIEKGTLIEKPIPPVPDVLLFPPTIPGENHGIPTPTIEYSRQVYEQQKNRIPDFVFSAHSLETQSSSIFHFSTEKSDVRCFVDQYLTDEVVDQIRVVVVTKNLNNDFNELNALKQDICKAKNLNNPDEFKRYSIAFDGAADYFMQFPKASPKDFKIFLEEHQIIGASPMNQASSNVSLENLALHRSTPPSLPPQRKIRSFPNALPHNVNTSQKPIEGFTHHESASSSSDISQSSNTKDLYFVYKYRWVVLSVFNLTALLNTMICFSISGASHMADNFFKGSIRIHYFSEVFFLSFGLFSLPLSILSGRLGLEKMIKIASGLQFIGCLTRSVYNKSGKGVLIGQLLAAIASAPLINSSVEVSVSWFDSNQRTLATTLSMTSSTFGIAAAFILSAFIVKSPEDIPLLLHTMTVFTAIDLVLVILFFKGLPPISPNKAAAMRLTHRQDKMRRRSQSRTTDKTEITPESVRYEICDGEWRVDTDHHHLVSLLTPQQRFLFLRMIFQRCNRFIADNCELIKELMTPFQYPGFVWALASFSLSETFLNCWSSELNFYLTSRGLTHKFAGVVGILFITSNLIGSIMAGIIVDMTKCYRSLLIINLLGASIATSYLTSSHIVEAILSIGFFLGPLQAVSLEAATEVTYPLDETLNTALIQVVGNFLSAASLELFHQQILNPKFIWSLSFISGTLGILIFCRFSPMYRRLRLEGNSVEKEIPFLCAVPPNEHPAQMFS